MTKTEAQIRNWNISQLRSFLPRMQKLMPEDIENKIQQRDLKIFYSVAEKIVDCLRDIKKKNFTCNKCNNIKENAKPTRNKLAYRCDFCNKYNEVLYTIKSIKGK